MPSFARKYKNRIKTNWSSRQTRALQHQKGNKVTMGTNIPRSVEGAVGDITVRDIGILGLRCYIKTDSGWYDINTMQSANKTQWIKLPLENSWEEHGATTTPGYFKDASGFVHLRGVIKNDSSYNATFATLPAGFRPHRQIYVPAHKAGTGAHVAIGVSSLGVCTFSTGTDKGQEYIDGVSFYSGQKIVGSGGGTTGGSPSPGPSA